MSNKVNFDFFRKINSFTKIIFYEFFSLFFLIIRVFLLIIKPFIIVRIVFIQSSRIGGFVRMLDRLIHFQTIRKGDKEYYFIFHENYISNYFLLNLFKKKIKKFKNSFFFNESIFSKLLMYSYKKYTFGKSLFSFETDLKYNDVIYSRYGKIINLAFSFEDKTKGESFFEKLNIPKDKKWICIHNRDSLYLEKFKLNINTNLTKSDYFSYHSYRDFDVNNFSKAAELFNNEGYHVFRVGSMQKEKMDYKNSSFTDYSFNSERSDFNDVYLLSNCSAYLGSDSGVADIPLIFGKPRYLINFSLSLIYVFHQDGDSASFKNNYSFIFKHLFDTKNKRKLSLKDLFKYDLFRASRTDTFKKVGVDLIENTKEEIYDISKELLSDFNNEDKNITDYEQQKKFWDIYYSNTNFKRYEDIPVKICSKFLSKNPYILE